MIDKNIKYSLDDLTMIPAVQSTIDSRSECDPFDSLGMLPLITSPMYSVIDEINAHLFEENGIYAAYPRKCQDTEDFIWHESNKIPTFKSYGLEEFIQKFLKQNEKIEIPVYACIDIANGHMIKLTETVRKAKEKYGNNLILMVGNIAHPDTYTVLSGAGADYVRLGVGTGNACITSCNSSCHYPMGSLIDECRKRKDRAKIIADGGMKNFDDIIKALGLGADYVMCGSIFNKAMESSGRTFVEISGFGIPDLSSPVDQYSESTMNSFKMQTTRYLKEYYGMSTKRAQKEMGNKMLKTSEGITKYVNVEYTLPQWTENFIHYLRTAMSYTGKRNLDEFIGNVDFNVISNSAHAAYRK